MNGRCPMCETMLVGFTMDEGIMHLRNHRADPPATVVAGIESGLADELYRQFTGNEPPTHFNEYQRIVWYESSSRDTLLQCNPNEISSQ